MRRVYFLFSTAFVCFLLLYTSFSLVAQEKSLQLYVENVEVTKENASNVLAGMGEGKDGCVSFDFESYTLTLKDARLGRRITITAERPDKLVTIRLEGRNVLDSYGNGIELYTPVLVEGPGELHISTKRWGTNGCGFRINGADPGLYLKIKDTKVRIE